MTTTTNVLGKYTRRSTQEQPLVLPTTPRKSAARKRQQMLDYWAEWKKRTP